MFSTNTAAEKNSNKVIEPAEDKRLINALAKVQRQVQPSLVPRDDALEYIQRLIIQLCRTLCASQPHSVQDVEERVSKTFPHPIDKWAIGDAQAALEKGKKKTPLVLPVDKIHQLLVKEILFYKIDLQVTLYIVAVLEYISADILKLTGNYVKNMKNTEISCQDIKVAMCADKVLMEMFFQEEEVSFSLEEQPMKRKSLTYEGMIKDLVLEEEQYIRDLNMIIKVFRAPFAKLFPRSKDLEVIFSNILDIHGLSVNLLSSLEDTIEMTEETEVPYVGNCFEELAEAEEFDVYVKYAEDMLKPHSRERLNTLLMRSDVQEVLAVQGENFRDAVKYVLPKLLLGPIYHCFHYSDVIKLLMTTTENEDDKFSLEQALGLLKATKAGVERKCQGTLPKRRIGETTLRFHGHMGRQTALQKMNELQKSIDGWEGKHIGESCNEFIIEGLLHKYAGKKLTERYVFLFDGLIILCKQNLRRSSVTGPVAEYRLKEKFFVRKIEIVDKEDSDEIKHAFEIQPREGGNVILVAKNADEKNNWMAALVALHTRSSLERMLDGILQEEEKRQPLWTPSPENYYFAVEDSEDNIVFEEPQDAYETPVIRGGTLLKLVQRLTYHNYADTNFVRTFLTTYRSFCKPHELLDLLIARFNIPEPPLGDNKNLTEEEMSVRLDDLKRFRLAYSKPIRFRVLNVFRQWVDKHFYDFEIDETLLDKLRSFLATVKGKAMKKGVDSILKLVQRKLKQQECPDQEIKFSYEKQPPVIEWHLARDPEEFNLMLLHPIEIARQVTLLEFDLYRKVRPSELVGNKWIKKDKNLSSPNLLKMIHHSTMFTFWLEKNIVESENFEERIAVISRILEIMLVFQELNNFNGMLEVVSAINSAPVYRLEHTIEEVPHKLKKAFEEAMELNNDHFKKYIEKLRSINPPCVPFLGMYLTNIFLTEEGNSDFLLNRPEGIINFSKRRKVAEITGEIQQYQNQPYCLQIEESIRAFFENLDPLEGMTDNEFNDYLYKKSLEIEPRYSKQPLKFPRQTDYPLKSPGTKPSAARHSTTSSITAASSSSKPAAAAAADDEEPLLSRGATPPTPSTPQSPPHTSSSSSSNNQNDNSVFAPVMIGGSISSLSTICSVSSSNTIGSGSGSGTAGTGTGSVFTINSLTSIQSSTTTLTSGYESSDTSIPPPVPPRQRRREITQDPSPHRHRHSSSSHITDRTSVDEAPAIPPREGRLNCAGPPVPPRRDTFHGTLPRAQSMSLPRQPQSNYSSTLPRRNSDRGGGQFNINGDNEPTPELPPKTYKSKIDRNIRR
ncbi:son of sevenless homolog 2-like [Tubulanus polymorphus]|uniref:son of sevenless homolog 2-like n=1 Tax=Tubulanus polymorphus TaxID=672921 RepID=UPI003DA4CA41